MEKIDLRQRETFSFPYVSATLLVIIFFAYLLAPFGSQLFAELSLTSQVFPEFWRGISAHFLHTDTNHLFWNVCALAVCGFAIEQRSLLLMLSAWLVGSTVVTIWFFMQSEFDSYVGASGVLNTTFLILVYTTLWQKKTLGPRSLAVLIVIIHATKNIVELNQGVAFFSRTIWDPTPGAHITGMIGGAITIVGYSFSQAIWKRKGG